MRCVLSMLAVSLVLSCQSQPFADMTQTVSFAKHGVAFDYPGNWTLTENKAGVKDGAALHAMTIRAPSGAFVAIQAFEERMKLDVDAWAKRLVKDYELRFSARAQSLESSPIVAVERQLLGEVRQGLKQPFMVKDGDRTAHLDAQLFVAEFPGGTATVLVQASPEDVERGKEGFDLVLNTLKWTRPAPDREVRVINIEAPANADGEPDLDKARVLGVSKEAAPVEGATTPPPATKEPAKPEAAAAPAAP